MMRRIFHSWERSIFNADAADRRPQSFAWGVEHLADLDVDGDGSALPAIAAKLCRESESFYRAGPLEGVCFDGARLTFDSPLPSTDAGVRRAAARFFPARKGSGAAVIVVPQWNADRDSMVGACRILNRFGFDVLRMTLPYHEERRPPRMVRADAMVSPVVGLTLQSVRRAVIEVRLAARWLRGHGVRRVGLLGTSLGSCVGFLALAHDDDLEVAAFNHVAGQFADVVWEGLATRHVRERLAPHIDVETLRLCWAPISPASFADRLSGRRLRMLMISGAYDPIFLPEHGDSLAAALRGAGIDFRRVMLPCGHYTLGRPPFYLVDAWLVIRFFRRHLKGR